MDPNLFHVDLERLFEVLIAIIVLAFFLERALSIVFENKRLIVPLSKKGLKEAIAFGVAVFVCVKWDFDAISTLLMSETTNHFGQVITGAIIAGGSKASIKLFHDVLDSMSNAQREIKEAGISTSSVTTVVAAETTTVTPKTPPQAAQQAGAG